MDQHDEIKRLRRASRRSEQFPEDATCERCGETDTRALIPGKALCYRCDGLVRGRSLTENHHIAGKHNSQVTVPVPANEHRILTDMQNDWPEKTLRNSEKSPLRVMAAHARGTIDTLKVIVERILGWVPVALEQLDESLCTLHGPAWWELPAFQPFVQAVPRWAIS